MKQKVNSKYFLSDWNLFGTVYTCKVQCEVISQNADLEFCGRHWISKDNYDVKGVSFVDCVVSKVPQGLKKTFPSLQFLQIYNSKLKVVERLDLKDYSGLLALHLGHNLIEFLPGDLLVNFRSLEALSFSNNRIQIIGPNLLDGLRSLKFVSFRKNLCIDLTFDLLNNSGNATFLDIKEKIRELNEPKVEESNAGSDQRADVKPISTNFVDVQRENEVLTYQNVEFKVKCELLSDENVKMSREIQELKQKVTKLEEQKTTELEDMRTSYESGILGDFKQILKNENFKNFTITVENRDFHVHRLLLAARSPVFALMLQHHADADSLTLTDISIDTFRIILEFLYTDELPPADPEIDFTRIFVTASKLKIEKLKDFAEERLTLSTNPKNAFELLIISNKYEGAKLRQKSFEEIKKLFPNKPLDEGLATQTEKLKKLLDFKRKQDSMMRRMEDEFDSMLY